MKSINLIISLLLSLAFVGAAGPARADGQVFLEARSYVLALKINEARANPRLVLERLQIPAAQAAAALGAEAWILDEGLPALVWNEQLQAAALAHGRDMLANNYFAYVSPDGAGPAARIAAAGYEALAVDETLAALDFDQYLAPDTALDLLVDNMLRDELSGVPGVNRNIFSAALTEIGIAFLAESAAGPAPGPNSYLLVADFADSAQGPPSSAGLTALNYQLWHKINEARANPRLVLERLSISAARAAAVLGPEAWILDEGLPPLALNELLRSAAQAHGRDMFANFYYSHYSPLTGRGPEERAAAAGYEAEQVEEALALRVFSEDRDPAVVLDLLLDAMLSDELLGLTGAERLIFSARATEIGLDYRLGATDKLPGNPDIYLIVLDGARPLAPSPFIIGITDPQCRLMRHNLATGFWDVVPTMPSGLFQTRKSATAEEIVVLDQDHEIADLISSWVLAGEESCFVDLRGCR